MEEINRSDSIRKRTTRKSSRVSIYVSMYTGTHLHGIVTRGTAHDQINAAQHTQGITVCAQTNSMHM